MPLLPTNAQRATHDYQRHGTVDLFAALGIASGTAISDIRAAHTQDDFLAFLNKIPVLKWACPTQATVCVGGQGWVGA